MVDTISNRTFKIMIFFFLIYFFPSFLPLSRLNFQLFFQLIVIKIQRDREQIIYDRLTSNESIPKLRFENRSKRNITRESDTVHALSLNAISWSVYRLNRRIDPFENRQAEPISHSRTSSQSPLTSRWQFRGGGWLLLPVSWNWGRARFPFDGPLGFPARKYTWVACCVPSQFHFGNTKCRVSTLLHDWKVDASKV